VWGTHRFVGKDKSLKAIHEDRPLVAAVSLPVLTQTLQAVGLAEFSYHLPGITMLPVDGLVHGLHFLCCDFARQAGKGGS